MAPAFTRSVKPTSTTPSSACACWNTKSKSHIPGSTLISPAESTFTHEIYAQVGLGLARLLTTGVSPDGRRLMSVTYREGRSGHAPGIMVRSWDIASGRRCPSR